MAWEMKYQPNVVLDFDGVIHSYASGWQGVDVVPDPPVPLIDEEIKRIRAAGYRVVVVSTRCATPEGMGSVRRYLRENGIEVDDVAAEKPPAKVYVDDRAMLFDGNPKGLLEKIQQFRPWQEGGPLRGKPPAPTKSSSLRCSVKLHSHRRRGRMRYAIGRPIEGVTLNGNEYVLDGDGKLMTFDSEEDALDFLKACGFTDNDIKGQGVVIEEVQR